MLDLCEDEDNMVSFRDKFIKKFCFYGWMKMYIVVSEMVMIYYFVKLMTVGFNVFVFLYIFGRGIG